MSIAGFVEKQRARLREIAAEIKKVVDADGGKHIMSHTAALRREQKTIRDALHKAERKGIETPDRFLGDSGAKIEKKPQREST